MREILNSDADMARVLRDDETGRTYLDVVCGGIGMYTRRLELTPEKADRVLAEPGFLHTLALRVQKWPDRYRSRLGGAPGSVSSGDDRTSDH